MHNRDVVILLDIDNTLIDFDACTDKGVVWNGGLSLWQYYLELLIERGAMARITVHVGIATFKERNGILGQSGDSLSATVLEDKEYKHEWIQPGCGLKKYLDPDLVFFTGFHCKIEHAMTPVKSKFPNIANEDIMIIDDSKTQVCDKAIAKGYSAYCVGSDLVQLTHLSRTSRIAKVFAGIYTQLKLEIPEQIRTQMKEPETTLQEIAKLITLQRNKLLSMNPIIQTESLESLKEQGIQSLDDDEDDYFNQPH